MSIRRICLIYQIEIYEPAYSNSLTSVVNSQSLSSDSFYKF